MSPEDWLLNDQVSSLIRHVAHALSRSTGFSASDREDIEQEIRIDLLKKVTKFDPSRSSPCTFAARVIQSNKKSMRRAIRRQKRDATDQVSIDAIMDDGRGGNPTTLAQTIEESDGRRHTGQRMPNATELHQLKLDVAEANINLPAELRQMAALLSHVRPFVAAHVMGVSRRSVAQFMETLRECYEARGLAG
jgi:RNA polymerase sigma-70 factor, ECF subfamily